MKILIVTANFAPRCASPSIRTVNMVKYLERAKNQVKVLTYDEASLLLFSPPDTSLSLKVPENVAIKRIFPGPLRRRLVKKTKGQLCKGIDVKGKHKNNVLLPMLIPDPHLDSVPGFYIEGKRQIIEFTPDLLVTFGYPFSLHLVGALLKRKFPYVFWLADYGDPWTDSPISELPRPRWRKYIDRKLEKKLLSYADLVSFTTENTKTLYENNFPFLKNKMTVVPMGFDHEDFQNLHIQSRSPEERKQLWLVHPGRIYSDARDPMPFINALVQLIKKNPQARKIFRVFLVGEVEEKLKEKMQRVLVDDVLKFVSWVTHEESLSWMMRSDFLLLFGNRGNIQIPGKVYQYLGSKKPIFMVNISEKDPTLLIVSKVPGSVTVANQETQILGKLEEIFSHKGETTISDNYVFSAKFSWEVLVKNLLTEIKLRIFSENQKWKKVVDSTCK